MKYLSIDTETTGLSQDSLIVEFGAVPVDIKDQTINKDLSFHSFIKCPSFEELTPVLSPFALANNKPLIDKAHKQGIPLAEFKEKLTNYLMREDVQNYFGGTNKSPVKPVILGKSLSALDLPLLTRDLGWDYMRQMFYHQNLDVSSMALTAIAKGVLPLECSSSSKLAKHLLGKQDVDHTAVEDACDAATICFKILNLL